MVIYILHLPELKTIFDISIFDLSKSVLIENILGIDKCFYNKYRIIEINIKGVVSWLQPTAF